MTTFVDYAWWQVSPAQLSALGFSGAMRYGVPGNSKSITTQELINLRAAGFDVGLVYETTAGAAGQGFDVGVADAKSANYFADGLGYPKTCTLFYAVDFDADPAKVQPYFHGVASVGVRPSAPYGSAKVIDGVAYPAAYGWQTAAWSAGAIAKRAGLLQNGFHDTYDSNRVLVADFGQWRAHLDPKPVLTEERMPTIRIPEPGPDSPRTADGKPYEKGAVATVPGTKGLVQVAADGYPGGAPTVRVAIGSGRADGVWKHKSPDAGIHENVYIANWPANWAYDHSTPFGVGFDEEAAVVNFGPGDVTVSAIPG